MRCRCRLRPERRKNSRTKPCDIARRASLMLPAGAFAMPKSSPKSSSIKKTSEYREGWAAWNCSRPSDPYGRGVDIAACPYSQGEIDNSRTRFLSGWWDGYINDWLERFEARIQQRMKSRTIGGAE